MPVIRPMTQDDVAAVHDLAVTTFEDLARRLHEPSGARPDPLMAHMRYRHLVRTDPAGAWVAEDERGIGGCALALKREGVWGLSLLIVRPDLQSAGVGGELLRRANEYADGARGRIILSSPDPRAMRAYSRLGLEAHPCLWAAGTPRVAADPSATREGTKDDLPFTEIVDRHVRGAAHGSDIGVQLEMGQTLLIAPERGYAVIGVADGELRILAAFDDDAARVLLRAALARGGDREASVSWLSAKQQWAIEECRDAGLELRANHGGVFVDGDVGPFTPYIPSGAFL
jgi:GNAT superfamily N-acetyltransferase